VEILLRKRRVLDQAQNDGCWFMAMPKLTDEIKKNKKFNS